MEWLQPVDFYCERLGPGFGAEPFNTLTGLSFLVVGLVSFRRSTQGDDRRASSALALVGVASALQHALAVEGALWFDVAANLGYLVLLGVLMLRRLAGVGAVAALAGAMAAVAVAYTLGENASLPFFLVDFFALLFMLLVVVALAQWPRHPQTARGIALAAAILALGLPFRFLDAAFCAQWPLGTHGIWHLLNAIAAALLLSALARHRTAG